MCDSDVCSSLVNPANRTCSFGQLLSLASNDSSRQTCPVSYCNLIIITIIIIIILITFVEYHAKLWRRLDKAMLMIYDAVSLIS